MKSAVMFKNTKITSCQSILQKNGQAVCMAFTNGAPKPVDLGAKKSAETVALSADQFKVRENLHAGMLKKPLERYHPNSFRSRLA
jgi:rubrerythrin